MAAARRRAGWRRGAGREAARADGDEAASGKMPRRLLRGQRHESTCAARRTAVKNGILGMQGAVFPSAAGDRAEKRRNVGRTAAQVGNKGPRRCCVHPTRETGQTDERGNGAVKGIRCDGEWRMNGRAGGDRPCGEHQALRTASDFGETKGRQAAANSAGRGSRQQTAAKNIRLYREPYIAGNGTEPQGKPRL